MQVCSNNNKSANCELSNNFPSEEYSHFHKPKTCLVQWDNSWWIPHVQGDNIWTNYQVWGPKNCILSLFWFLLDYIVIWSVVVCAHASSSTEVKTLIYGDVALLEYQAKYLYKITDIFLAIVCFVIWFARKMSELAPLSKVEFSFSNQRRHSPTDFTYLSVE